MPAYFDTYAGDYTASVERSVGFTGRKIEFFHQRKIDVLRRIGGRHLASMAAASVLDVGCGAGVTGSMLRPYVASVHGIDVSPLMVQQARERSRECTFDVFDGSRLPFDDCSFDLVMTICVLHHVPPERWEPFTAELVRVVRPGGLAVIIEHNRLNPMTRRAVNTCPFDADAVLVPHRRAARMLRAAGAQPVEIHNFLFSPLAGRVGSALERGCSPIPFGGQYAAAGFRASSPSVAVRFGVPRRLPAPANRRVTTS